MPKREKGIEKGQKKVRESENIGRVK